LTNIKGYVIYFSGGVMKQQYLFENKEWWEELWEGMPEFVQEDIMPFRKIVVSFKSAETVKDLFSIIGQSYTPNTRSIWYPKIEIGETKNKKYINKSDRNES
jgi:hypothetical protein